MITVITVVRGETLIVMLVLAMQKGQKADYKYIYKDYKGIGIKV